MYIFRDFQFSIFTIKKDTFTCNFIFLPVIKSAAFRLEWRQSSVLIFSMDLRVSDDILCRKKGSLSLADLFFLVSTKLNLKRSFSSFSSGI